MKIASSQLRFGARNQSQDVTQRVGQSIARGRTLPSTTITTETRRSLESTRQSQQQATSKLTAPCGTQVQHMRSDSRQSSLRMFAASQSSATARATNLSGSAHTYSLQELQESSEYHLSGRLSLHDGKNIEFDITGSMSRSLRIEEASGIHTEKLQQKDPLILNFAASSAQLTERAFDFDIDADGQKDQVSFATNGSGFLFLDRNNNGALDDGSELFGARTGDGFAELAGYDEDRNGFIDSGDSIYAQLKLMSRNENGEDNVTTLAERDIGALGLQSVSTEFEITNDYQQSRGRLRATGVAVSETGAVMTLQQVDLTQRNLSDEAQLRERFESPVDSRNPILASQAESAIADALQRLQDMTQEMQQRLRENTEPEKEQEYKSLLELLVERVVSTPKEESGPHPGKEKSSAKD